MKKTVFLGIMSLSLTLFANLAFAGEKPKFQCSNYNGSLVVEGEDIPSKESKARVRHQSGIDGFTSVEIVDTQLYSVLPNVGFGENMVFRINYLAPGVVQSIVGELVICGNKKPF